MVVSNIWVTDQDNDRVEELTPTGTYLGQLGGPTGNGQLKTVHGNSPCAFSGQEDNQWYTDNSDTTLRADPTRDAMSVMKNRTVWFEAGTKKKLRSSA